MKLINGPSKKYTMNKEDKILSKICRIEYYLTSKVIDNRGTNYRPYLGDEDQPLRDMLLKLRKQIGILK